jgi:hypothetical protein
VNRVGAQLRVLVEGADVGLHLGLRATQSAVQPLGRDADAPFQVQLRAHVLLPAQDGGRVLYLAVLVVQQHGEVGVQELHELLIWSALTVEN